MYLIVDKCKKTVAGQEYRGIVSQTKKGVECQRWDSKERVPRGITPNTHRQFGLDENFCRNPDGEPEGPWCYTTSPEKRWDYCDVPLCGKLFIDFTSNKLHFIFFSFY